MNQNRKKLLSMVLAAAMILSVPLSGFAQNPLNNVDSPVPYLQPDTTPPVLHSVSAEKTEVKAGESIFITVDAEDDISGLLDYRNPLLNFINQKNGREISAPVNTKNNNGEMQCFLKISEYEEAGIFELESVNLQDNAGNYVTYRQQGVDFWEGDLPLPNEFSFTVLNDGIVDLNTPELKSVSVDKEFVDAPGSIEVGIDAVDEPAGISNAQVTFRNSVRGSVSAFFRGDNDKATINITEYTAPGKYTLSSVTITDKMGNRISYGTQSYQTPFPFDEDVSFVVNNESTIFEDETAPVLKSAKFDKGTVEVTDKKELVQLILEIDDGEKSSGIESVYATLEDRTTKRTIYSEYMLDGQEIPAGEIYFLISPYESSGSYELDTLQIRDKAGNFSNYVSKNHTGGNVGQELPQEISLNVVNNWDGTDPDPDPKPEPPVPGYSEDHTGNNEPSNDSKHSNDSDVVNYESEKPNPADKKAVEAYNFWQNAKAKVRTTPDGKTMRLFVPKDITYMPASMMETLYREKITLIITHNGKKIVIPAGKAMPKQKLKVYWTFESLEKLYQA